MNIGILTFYKVANFGANLQGISTYFYLKNKGYHPIFLNYVSEATESTLNKEYQTNSQTRCHLDFVNKMIPEQSENLHNSTEVIAAIEKHNIDAIIIGSDAVVQHHPLLSRIHQGKRKPFYIARPAPERMFPNPFWGIGFSEIIPTAMMSVSSQNSRYAQFSKKLKKRMGTTLSCMKYISVRDTWTKDLMHSINEKLEISITPDPVFAFNNNVSNLIPTESDIRTRFNLPEHYILVSLHSQSLSPQILSELHDQFKAIGKTCVAFPMPGGINFNHSFDYQINTPLSPIDWYALIKYADAYIGSNMHPIIVSLHNAVPCFSIDHWGTKNFFNKTIRDGSSKVEHILNIYGLKNNIRPIDNGFCDIKADEIVKAIIKFPKKEVMETSKLQHEMYEKMMDKILSSLTHQ